MSFTGGLPILPAVLLYPPVGVLIFPANITLRMSPSARAVASSRPAVAVAGGYGGGRS